MSQRVIPLVSIADDCINNIANIPPRNHRCGKYKTRVPIHGFSAYQNIDFVNNITASEVSPLLLQYFIDNCH